MYAGNIRTDVQVITRHLKISELGQLPNLIWSSVRHYAELCLAFCLFVYPLDVHFIHKKKHKTALPPTMK